MTTTSSVPPSKGKLWLAAIKPPMYSVAIIPITVGTATAFGQNAIFDPKILGIFLTSAILIIAWLNISNDVFDADTGIDKNKAHSLVNLTGNKALMLWLANGFLSLGVLGILLIAWLQQDITVLSIILLCCVLGYTYQGPPFRLGYQGLGELICFFTFGPMAIAAAYYSQTQEFSWSILAPGTLIGISTSIILFCSHFHQVEDDLAAGKRSPIVRLGTQLGSQVLMVTTILFFALIVLFSLLGIFSIWTFLTFLSIPLAYQLVSHVNQNHAQPDRVSNCKFIAVRLHFFSGLLLALGLIIPSI
ncbi:MULTISPECIES: 2-carboxy-1,4-naphthoquinone phytyltransferase [Crocosphaera]|uniref:2-carboxy-1,4-naphthoquinone phytyltransferase n=4 Tax=Crocosphaera watsonii TaxID=263511 RepID=T2JTZ8_CROWT|nr:MULTISPECIES: 2-carboxy-1,4-naphthoquinone phytyltransferase [Crocosphaera]EHJ14007.1 1,4-dihydroxy-2-naphthoate octaprenyltransferase [Crocosphaera watsonii WH 0003]MCH2246854.1 2-carboxy-1,4-naphthoquinone phytyltransferase [Crocosphaera sp.]NQZ63136.1 2-carboxy-1,4-naphthoquinone phytyltransferase [Crocosphaera sp.]CCQ49673.1 1,4-dihydroxy-2-naphthoate octaprenyltransferase [Crocosphaera watsonii WH 8502]CCQ59559.1 1,4-dihydroxy-2-naphthoate octaprenyltransferase [Crocosphaera watsonii W